MINEKKIEEAANLHRFELIASISMVVPLALPCNALKK